MSAPCYNCERRSAECHASCEDYKDFAQERREYAERLHKESVYKGYFIDGARHMRQLKRRRNRE